MHASHAGAASRCNARPRLKGAPVSPACMQQVRLQRSGAPGGARKELTLHASDMPAGLTLRCARAHTPEGDTSPSALQEGQGPSGQPQPPVRISRPCCQHCPHAGRQGGRACAARSSSVLHSDGSSPSVHHCLGLVGLKVTRGQKASPQTRGMSSKASPTILVAALH